MLIIAFIVFYILKHTTVTNSLKYPSSTDCDAIYALFVNKGGPLPESDFSEYALKDKALTGIGKGTGMY